MLYERWRQVAAEHSRAVALRELWSGRHWTFSQLALESERVDSAAPPVVCPRGINGDFVLTVLRAWRSGRAVLPLEQDQSALERVDLPPSIAHLKTTSASTGLPRVVALTAGQLASDARNIVETMGLRPDWPNLGVISLAHSYGFSNLVLPLLLHGIPLLLLEAPLPEAVRRACTVASQITVPAVPALWRAWHEAGALGPSIQLAISAGAPLPLSLEQDVFQSVGIKLHNFYGASECGGIAYDASATPRLDPASAGHAMNNVRLAVADDGCLEVRSGAVAQTYWPAPEPTLANGCYHTSDLAELNDGELFLRGRRSDQINVAGRKLSPEGIERLLSTHPQVRDCLVFGLPSLEPGRVEVAVAAVAAGGAVSAEELRQFLLARLPAWQVPREWWFVDSLAPNSRGKLSRSDWRRKYLQRAEGKSRRLGQ